MTEKKNLPSSSNEHLRFSAIFQISSKVIRHIWLLSRLAKFRSLDMKKKVTLVIKLRREVFGDLNAGKSLNRGRGINAEGQTNST